MDTLTACPTCRTVVDAWTAIADGTRPRPMHDPVVCFYCAAINAYDHDGRLVTHPDEVTLAEHPEIARVRAAIIPTAR